MQGLVTARSSMCWRHYFDASLALTGRLPSLREHGSEWMREAIPT